MPGLSTHAEWYVPVSSSTHFSLPLQLLCLPLPPSPEPDCFWLLDVLLKYAIQREVPSFVSSSTSTAQLPPAFLPKRMEGCAITTNIHVRTTLLSLPTSREPATPLLQGGCSSRSFPLPPSSDLPSIHLGQTPAHQHHQVSM